MAITSLDSLLAGMQPIQTSIKAPTRTNTVGAVYNSIDLFNAPGIPNNPTLGAIGVNGVTLTAPVDGQMIFTNPPGGKAAYLSSFGAYTMTNGPCIFQLCDRIWHNTGLSVTSTSAQAIVTPTWPARDQNGTTNGEGIRVGHTALATTAMGTPAASAVTISYTNSAGTSGRTAQAISQYNGTAAQPGGMVFGYQSGDTGIQSIQSWRTANSMTTGSITLFAYRIIAQIESPNGATPNVSDFLKLGLPIVYNDSVLFVLAFATTAASGSVFNASCGFTFG